MSQDNTISVIIAAYNATHTIRACLDSVAAQDVPPDQILVVDDASTDQTTDIARAWMANHADVPVALIVQPHNGGPAAARNAGIAAATGQWIAFLDADDAWLPWHLNVQSRTIAQYPDAVLLCARTVDLETTPANGDGIPRPGTVDPMHLTSESFLAQNPVATSTVLARRDKLQAAGGFDPAFRGPEDYDLWLRMAACGRCLHIPVITSRYRTTIGSLSMDDRRFLPEVLRVLDKAFGPGGALQHHQDYRRRALAEQYASASWMAYNRGDRPAAVRLLIRSWLQGPILLKKERTAPLQRIKLLIRYLCC